MCGVWGGAGGIRLCLAAEPAAGLLRLTGRRGMGVAGRAAAHGPTGVWGLPGGLLTRLLESSNKTLSSPLPYHYHYYYHYH